MLCQSWTQCVLYHRLQNLSLQSRAVRFQDMCGKKGPEKGSLPRVTFWVPDVQSSFLRFTDVEVTKNNPKRSRITGPMRSDKE